MASFVVGSCVTVSASPLGIVYSLTVFLSLCLTVVFIGFMVSICCTLLYVFAARSSYFIFFFFGPFSFLFVPPLCLCSPVCFFLGCFIPLDVRSVSWVLFLLSLGMVFCCFCPPLRLLFIFIFSQCFIFLPFLAFYFAPWFLYLSRILLLHCHSLSSSSFSFH